MTPVRVDVLAPLPEGWGLCLTCEAILSQAELAEPAPARALEGFPPDWQADFAHLSRLVKQIAGTFGSGVLIRLFDPRSPQGMWKAVRCGARQYPVFLVTGQPKIVGLDQEGLEKAIMAAQQAIRAAQQRGEPA